MTTVKSRQVQLLSRPQGAPTADNFQVAEVDLKAPEQGEVLVRNLFLSVDPYMRGRMNESKSYVPPFPIGGAMEGGALGEVLESKFPQLLPGDLVVSNYGWREAFVASGPELRKVDPSVQPVSAYLGLLGMTGMTA